VPFQPAQASEKTQRPRWKLQAAVEFGIATGNKLYNSTSAGWEFRTDAGRIESEAHRNWYDLMDRMEKANRNGECDVIERFASSLGRNPRCTYNFETKSHTLELSGQPIAITREDFDDRKWQKKIRTAIQPRRAR
jgi:hypothetical protein